MSHWTVFTSGSIESQLEDAWAERRLGKDVWVSRLTERLERHGNMNPSNIGFIVLAEKPDPRRPNEQQGVVIPKSVDWAIIDAVEEKLRQLGGEDALKEERYFKLYQDACRTIRQKFIVDIPQQVEAFLASAPDVES